MVCVVIGVLLTSLVLKGSVPKIWFTRPLETITALAEVGVGLGIFLYTIFRLQGASVTPQGLRAPSIWGRMKELPWASITDVKRINVQGLPALMVCSTATKAKCCVYTLGIDKREVYSRLLEFAGPSHVMTQWFKPNDALRK
jgi:hypothetical protein